MPKSSQSTLFFFPWYDSMPSHGMAGNWIMLGNQGIANTRVEIYIADARMQDSDNPANEYFSIDGKPAGLVQAGSDQVAPRRMEMFPKQY